MGVYVTLVCGDEEVCSLSLPIPPAVGMLIGWNGQEFRVYEVYLRPEGGEEYGVRAKVSRIG